MGNLRDRGAVLVAAVSLVSTFVPDQSVCAEPIAKDPPAASGEHKDRGPHFFFDVAALASTRVYGGRGSGSFVVRAEAGLKWTIPWLGFDRLGLGGGLLYSSVPNLDPHVGPDLDAVFYMAGHLRRPLGSYWGVGLSLGPILGCSECMALVDSGFVAKVSLDYRSKVAFTIESKLLAFDFGRPARPLGTEVDVMGGVQLSDVSAYWAIVPLLLMSAGYSYSLAPTSN